VGSSEESSGELGPVFDTDFDIGVIRTSSVNIKLNNLDGKYSDAGVTGSIFKFKRNDSLVKITWSMTPDILQCGFFTCGDPNAIIAEEKTIHVGLLNDDSAKMDVSSQFISFRVLGREDSFNKASITGAVFTAISNGDLTSDTLFTILNQSQITDVLTVSAANISVGSDQTIDDKTDLEGQTVEEAVKDFLRVSNSILSIDGDDVIISPRVPTSDVKHTFHGPASINGVENIAQLNNVSNGSSRIFNYLRWGDTSQVRSDLSSLDKYGVKKRSIDFSIFTDTTKRQNMLDSFITEYAVPKLELDLKTPWDYDTLELFLLDRVSIDYPTVITTDGDLPIVGQMIVGDASTPLPGEQAAFTITTLTNFKITRRSIDMKNQNVTFHLREI